MNGKLSELLQSMNIEYCAVLPYADCIEAAPRIRERSGFAPKAVIIYLLPYYTGKAVNISAYASSLDYHILLREVGEKIISFLSSYYPNAKFRSFGDHSPIDERHAALIGGLGIAGDNGLLINEKYGSYVFIGDVITDIDPDLLGATAPIEPVGCEHCGACRSACPTGILRGEGADCLSAITQRKGELTESEKALIREFNTAWGCDRCQSFCPHNYTPRLTPIEFFYRDRIDLLNREILDSMDAAAFSARAFAWRGRAVPERNVDILFGDGAEHK